MDCALCKKQIKDYRPEFNHLELDETHSVDVCLDCVDKFLTWQQGVYAKLFPTKAAKKKYGM